MTGSPDALVFDTGPLRHFAMNGWLGVLKFVAGERSVIIPESVEQELRRQMYELPPLQQVVESGWVQVDRSDDLMFVMTFAKYEQRLVVDGRNRGECGVLALGKTKGFETVLDDGVARKIAAEEGIRVTATLPLLCHAIREGQLTVAMVEALADDLLAGDYHLPFTRGGFRRWAHEQGFVEYG